MSFSGFVFDMIRRDKAYKDMLRLRRERRKDLQGKLSKQSSLPNPSITLEELEKIKEATREKEKEDQFYYTRTTLTILGAIAVASILILLIFF